LAIVAANATGSRQPPAMEKIFAIAKQMEAAAESPQREQNCSIL